MTSPLMKLNAFHLDILREIGNIGAGHAATALSLLLNKTVDMTVPGASIVPFDHVADRVGGFERILVAVFLRVEGEAPGTIYLMLEEQCAHTLLSRLFAMPLPDIGEFTEMHISALQEIGNILSGSYLSSLADFTKLDLQPSPPIVAVDMAGALLSFGLAQYGIVGDTALMLDTKFLDDADELESFFLFIPDPESFDKIFISLGVPIS